MAVGAVKNVGFQYAEDEPHVSGAVGTLLLGVRNDAGGTGFAGTNGDYSAIAVDSQGRLVFPTLTVAATSAAPLYVTPAISGNIGMVPTRVNAAASINATVLKASAGNLYGYILRNRSAAEVFVKFYNKATAPAPGADSALLISTISLPAGATVQWMDSLPTRFTTGIGFVTVTGISDTDATAVAAGDVYGTIYTG